MARNVLDLPRREQMPVGDRLVIVDPNARQSVAIVTNIG